MVFCVISRAESRYKDVFKQLLTLIAALVILLPATLGAQERRLQNRPYIDERRFHYGFHLGMHMQDLELSNNGYIDPDTGERWYADVDAFQPGFTVGVLGEMKLNKYLSLRICPTLDLGQKHVVCHEQLSGRDTTQTIKSTYITVPVALKFAAPRYNNFRPYMSVGVSPVVDLTNRKHGMLLTKKLDVMIELAMGCDVYFGFFKLIPELKFSFGILDVLQKNRQDLIDPTLLKFTKSLDSAHSTKVSLIFYFE